MCEKYDSTIFFVDISTLTERLLTIKIIILFIPYVKSIVYLCKCFKIKHKIEI
ncbi:MAG: hypothetical protein PWR08_912 [Thermoanaerobacterium sp.]|nr:hypothetical protein [Thermoanaerobacterium sp.]